MPDLASIAPAVLRACATELGMLRHVLANADRLGLSITIDERVYVALDRAQRGSVTGVFGPAARSQIGNGRGIVVLAKADPETTP